MSEETSATPVLEVKNLTASYGQIQAIHGIDFSVAQGEIVVILGANGAGKTTTLRAISGMIQTGGSVRLKGKEILGKNSADIVHMGVAPRASRSGYVPRVDRRGEPAGGRLYQPA